MTTFMYEYLYTLIFHIQVEYEVLGTSPIDLSQILTYTSTATEIKFMRDFYVDVWREKNLES
jgi:hypothetical protein